MLLLVFGLVHGAGKDGNVWYFGENAKQLADGLIVGVEGSWSAGVDVAKPGSIMEVRSAVRDFYRQEFSLATAEDIAEVVSLKICHRPLWLVHALPKDRGDVAVRTRRPGEQVLLRWHRQRVDD